MLCPDHMHVYKSSWRTSADRSGLPSPNRDGNMLCFSAAGTCMVLARLCTIASRVVPKGLQLRASPNCVAPTRLLLSMRCNAMQYVFVHSHMRPRDGTESAAAKRKAQLCTASLVAEAIKRNVALDGDALCTVPRRYTVASVAHC